MQFSVVRGVAYCGYRYSLLMLVGGDALFCENHSEIRQNPPEPAGIRLNPPESAGIRRILISMHYGKLTHEKNTSEHIRF